ncbi:DUF6266 family protein [Pedobacter africanus]|uniref:Uncharacterized protein n=1 Tax=Pedobacter africanus TaxID=151894 RepID=A0A1W2DI27_9SPHI|nr:DUF6266 family protein [Pedobacter africanus]SMC97160.1 hypothetical protein SAMN04488524_3849 [Pedobacter africanus]
MGILQSGPLGPFRKKTGPLIGRKHRGINVITSLHHTSKKKPTLKQSDAQYKFGLLNNFLKIIKTSVNSGFASYAKGQSAVNAAFSYNFDHAFVLDEATGEYQINYPKMAYSRGRIVTPEAAEVSVSAGQLSFSWQPQNQSAYCQFTDMASFLVYNPVRKTRISFARAVNRYAQRYTIEMPQDYAGEIVHCYMSFSSADGKQQGDSVYLGEVMC